MKKQKSKIKRLLVVVALCGALLVENFLMQNTAAEAATKKTTLSAAKMTIPVGEMGSKIYWNVNAGELGNAKKLTVNNKIKGASYSFTSSNTKVVKTGKDGGYLTGLKAGTATITCTQTYKNKKTTVGKCVVTVKNAILTPNEYGLTITRNGAFDLESFYACIDPLYYIGYRNPDATYTLTSDSNDFSIKEIKYDASKAKSLTNEKEYQKMLEEYIGDGYIYGYNYTTKKAGTYTITVKETYNKNTKTLGSFKVEVKDTCISKPEINVLIGNYQDIYSLLEFKQDNTNYVFSIEDYDKTKIDDNVLTYLSDNNFTFYANKMGTAKITIREGSETGTVIGTVTVTVTDAPCQDILVETNEFTTYVDDYFKIDYNLEPYETTDKVTIESDNPKVLKVEYDKEYGDWYYTPLKVGVANVTITCGTKSIVCKVVVEEY